MKRILITGALGQMGSELIEYLANIYGDDNILATDIKPKQSVLESAVEYEELDVLDQSRFNDLVKNFKADTIIHLAAILSFRGESIPLETFNINVLGTINCLETARKNKCQVFIPSSIACFGKDSPADLTPQTTIQRPNTMYGITKVTSELIADYYFEKYGVDCRGIRFPGIISHRTLPGKGTSDYAVHIYYDAIKQGSYECYLKKDTYMDMIYMPDVLKAIVDLMECDSRKLKHRNAFNITAMSLEPEMLKESILKFIPDFKLTYCIDPLRQSIADSWPNQLDDSCARDEWNFKPSYDLDAMTKDMLEKLTYKLKGNEHE